MLSRVYRHGVTGFSGAMLFLAIDARVGEAESERWESMGPAFVGLDVGPAYTFNKHFRLKLELSVLAAAPDFGAALEGSLGAAAGF